MTKTFSGLFFDPEPGNDTVRMITLGKETYVFTEPDDFLNKIQRLTTGCTSNSECQNLYDIAKYYEQLILRNAYGSKKADTEEHARWRLSLAQHGSAIIRLKNLLNSEAPK